MQFSTYGNGNGLDDLYVLPENAEERQRIHEFLARHNIYALLTRQKGKNTQDPWMQQTFFEIPAGECFREEIEKECTRKD